MDSQKIDLSYIEKWLPEASVKYKDGRPAVNLGLIITVFFKDGHLPEVRRNMVECVDRFYDENKQHLKKSIIKNKWVSISEKNYNNKKQEILNSRPEEIFSWYLGSSEEDFAAPDYSVLIMGKRIFQNENNRSIIKLTFPIANLKRNETLINIQDWILFICNLLNVESGYAGLSFILPYEFERMFPYEYSLAQRFTGVMIDSLGFLDGTNSTEGLKGACWYNIISTPWMNKLKWTNRISKILETSPEMSLIPYNNGIILKTGELPPGLGEITTEGFPPELVKVNQLIRPVRQDGHSGLHFYCGYDALVFDEESSKKWFARFDSASDLLTEHEGNIAPEDARITCNTGEPAPHAGHWATIKNGLLRDIHVSEGQRMPTFRDRKEQEFNVTWSLLEREDKGSVFK